MSRLILDRDRLEFLKAKLIPPDFAVDGELHPFEAWPSSEFSNALQNEVLDSWSKDANFRSAGPVWLGSAARGQLCPRSDLDLLFIGDETAAKSFILAQQENGVRLRSRLLVGVEDWAADGELPDRIALLDATAIFPEHSAQVEEQKHRVRAGLMASRRTWIKELVRDKKARRIHDNTVANMLEPNLKHGLGGSRDLTVAQAVAQIFDGLFENERHVRDVLESYLGFWILLRQWLHTQGYNDILSSSAQFDAARWLGMSHRDFMREVQKGLSRVDFYSDWILAFAAASPRERERISKTRVKTAKTAVASLEKDPSILMQRHVRNAIDSVFTASWKKTHVKERGRLLYQVLRPGANVDFIQSVFHSRVIDHLCPAFRPLVGLTQHDQYHRYTADSHLMQACVQWQKVYRQPRLLRGLASEVRKMTAADLQVMSWSVLYHDMMKGREGDHSVAGEKLVRKELKSFGVPAAIIDGVAWIVRHHLLLSQAAFRKNPLSPHTWTHLEEQGVTGAHLRRLAVFTAVDILATNPEAWTPWKARLLSELVTQLRSPTVRHFIDFHRLLSKNGLQEMAEELDVFLMTQIPLKALADDIRELKSESTKASVRIFKGRNGGVWIRFFDPVDRAGLLLEYVDRIFSLGYGVRHASIHTLSGMGVYDWFQLIGVKDVAKARARLAHMGEVKRSTPTVKFENVSLVSEDPLEWVYSCRGKDQPGCLRAAVAALLDEGVSIKSARVHTWGQQVDDLFHVQPKGDAMELLARLKSQLEN